MIIGRIQDYGSCFTVLGLRFDKSEHGWDCGIVILGLYIGWGG